VARFKSQLLRERAARASNSEMPMSLRRWIFASKSGNLCGPESRMVKVLTTVNHHKQIILPLAYEFVQCFAVLQNISKFSLYWEATTASCGSSGSAEAKSACNDNKTVLSVIAAAQLSFKISRQIAPVTELMFGCQIFVRNLTLGGLNGYVSGT
jgi:hypothetical protein